MIRNTNSFHGPLALTGRILLASIFIISGISKVVDPASTIAYLKLVHMPLPEVAYAIATALEVIGGVFLVLGYRVLPAAISLAVFSVIAAILFHGNIADQNQFAHFLKNISLAGGLLLVAALGAGSLSFDHRRSLAFTNRLG